MQKNNNTIRPGGQLLSKARAVRDIAAWIIVLAIALSPAADITASAARGARRLVPAGCTVGIEMELGGLMVVGLTPVVTDGGERCPSAEAGLALSDLIIKLGDKPTANVDDFISAASGLDGSPVAVMVKRGADTLSLKLTPAMSADGRWEMGLMLREGISGIGTVTFYDPDTGLYGALGHPISDTKTGALMPLGEGSVTQNVVSEVRMGKVGAPGEIIGSIDRGKTLGSILMNTDRGIFGRMNSGSFSGSEPVPVAGDADIELGPAKVRTNVQCDEVREFDIEISRIYRGDTEGRCMMIKVTDPELIAITGGIIQGMSGSPILQNGKLIGAVTHVLVGDPTRGYAIFIDRMLDYSDSLINTESAA